MKIEEIIENKKLDGSLIISENKKLIMDEIIWLRKSISTPASPISWDEAKQIYFSEIL